MAEQTLIPEKHKYLFDIYFHLGLGRNPMKLAKVSMPRLYPELEPGSKDYSRKLKSTYHRFRRWVEKEKWDEECSTRESSSRRQTDVLIKQEEQTLLDTVKLYRRGIRYVLNKFLENVANDLVDIKSPKEAKMLMELDMYLTTVIEKRPKLIKAQILELMTEEERRGLDRVFEYIRRQSQREDVIQDLEGVIDAEQVAIEADTIKELLPPAPNVEPLKEAEPGPQAKRFMHLPAFLKPVSVPDATDAQIEGEGVSRITTVMSTNSIPTLERPGSHNGDLGDGQDIEHDESIADDEPVRQAKSFDELIADDGKNK